MNRIMQFLFAGWFVCSMLFFCVTARADNSLNSILTPYLTKYELPALAAAVVKDGKIVSAGAVGTRRHGTDVPVTLSDRFHLGSDTKAMTSLLAAMLVEDGRLPWDATVGGVFPEVADSMDPDFRRITLQQLLTHTSGIPSDDQNLFEVLKGSMEQDGNLDELRYWFFLQWSKRPLQRKPGVGFAYSNVGYTIVGAMIERVSGKTWEELVVERIFTPLNLRSAGLGPQATVGKIDAPLGHVRINGKVKAFLSGANGDVPPILGPAGIAHMSILDFAAWAGWNAGEGRRGPFLVKPETMRKLHTPFVTMPEKKDPPPGTPPGGKYALGWGELTMEWAKRPLIYHGGSNSMNLAHIWLDPETDFAMVTSTNISDRKANEALYGLARELYRVSHPAPAK
ncbi:MAG: serine hydrolase [Desulfobacterales bacterium]|nr:serine hydrolase [Desulfobacterales bacterium]